MSEFSRIASAFTYARLSFFSSTWLDKFIGDLTRLLESTVKEHTSDVSNTSLREAALRTDSLVDHVIRHLPNGARACRCPELDDGEERAQPICHLCALRAIQRHTREALPGCDNFDPEWDR
jgi:hypothetical protein